MGALRRPPLPLIAGTLLAGGLFWAYPIILPIRFVSEEIRIKVEAPELVFVDARYDLVNISPFPVSLPFEYPLPPDRPGHATVVAVYDQHGPIPFSQRGDTVRIHLSWRGKESKALRVEYRHTTPNRRARYIVTTTRLWRLPIKEARFVVTSQVGPIAVQPWDQPTPGPPAPSWERTATGFFPQADIWVSW